VTSEAVVELQGQSACNSEGEVAPNGASRLAISLTQLAASRDVRPGRAYESSTLESAEESTRGRRAAGQSRAQDSGSAVVSV